jgi:hypothetical protein
MSEILSAFFFRDAIGPHPSGRGERAERAVQSIERNRGTQAFKAQTIKADGQISGAAPSRARR